MSKPKETRDYQFDHSLNVKADDLPFQIHNYDIDSKSNHIYLFGVDRGYEVTGAEGGIEPGVDYVMANRFIKNMNICMRRKGRKPILIHMKTNGGCWEEGMAIYDSIRSCPLAVTILNYTHARSMSSIIFQAANKRIMMPHSHFMFHQGTLGLEGTYKQVASSFNFTKKTDDEMLNIYIRRMKEKGEFTNKPIKYIKSWLKSQMDKKEDVYLTAEEAVKYGLADEVFDYNWKKLTIYSNEELQN